MMTLLAFITLGIICSCLSLACHLYSLACFRRIERQHKAVADGIGEYKRCWDDSVQFFVKEPPHDA